MLAAVAGYVLLRHGDGSPHAAPPPTPVAAAPAVHPDAALTAFGALPALTPDVLAGQYSSVDPAERNSDGAPANVLYRTPDGASVIFAASGPGVVENIWVAGSLAAMGDIRITLDGAPTPVVDMPATRFFSGAAAPFLAPLVGGAALSSGGDYSYVPIAFRTSCVIAFTGTTAYWHVDYQRLPAGSSVQPFSPTADLAPAAAVWAAAGQDPHQLAGTRFLTGQVDLPPGGARTLAQISGAGRIQALRLTVPGAAVAAPAPLTRSGVAQTGESTFTLHVDPSNSGVQLVRRFDYALPNQTAKVLVDGVAAGSFAAPGFTNGPYFWRDQTLALPASLTAGKSELHLTVLASTPFTAFTYWAYSLVGASPVLSDTFQLDPAGQRAHDWSADHVLWQRSLTSSYAPAALAASAALLQQLRLQITFDGQAAPAVDAPLGLFFGAPFGAATVRSLMLAVDPATGALASFWPMPFARQATVLLVNTGASAVGGIGYSLRYRPDAAEGAALAAGAEGYFHASYRSAAPTVPGHGYTLLSTAGSGRLVGVTLAMSTPPGMPYGLENLQGNEQIYLNGNPSPAYLGTGTEDFFQAGWYFQNGPFSLPAQGSPDQWVGPRYASHISAYRLFLSDAIPFYAGIHAGLQVGPLGNLSAQYSSVAYWYGLPGTTLIQTDALQPADPAAAAAHAYTAAGGVSTGPLTSVFQGRQNGVRVTAAGSAATAATFSVAVDPANRGVLLRAQFDQCPGRQAAEVYVDGTDVGLWSDPGSNCVERWLDSDFPLPPAVTRGRSHLQIRIVAQPGPLPGSGAPLWRVYGYQVLSFVG